MKLLLNLLVACLALAPVCYAEHLCRASVSYSWQRDKDVTKIIVFTSNLEVTGADEADAKRILQERAGPEKVKAAERCKREHENQAGCLAAKMNSLSSTMQGLTFSARKLLEDSIAADCKTQQGKCGEGELSEPQCVEKVVATKADEKPAKEAGGKDAKKKK